MKRKFAAPVLRDETAFARLTLGNVAVSDA